MKYLRILSLLLIFIMNFDFSKENYFNCYTSCMKKIKRAFALTLSLMMAFGVAACGSSDSSSNNSDDSFEATDKRSSVITT